jgi:hypothetical protein
MVPRCGPEIRVWIRFESVGVCHTWTTNWWAGDCAPASTLYPSQVLRVRSRKEQTMSVNDLEFAYAPVRDQVRDLREYL